MKFLLSFLIVFSTLSLSANDTVSVSANSSTENVISFHIDKKKQRRHKRTNKKRKKACHNWAKRSYAG
jgi:hypothetical protein